MHMHALKVILFSLFISMMVAILIYAWTNTFMSCIYKFVHVCMWVVDCLNVIFG